MADDFDRQAGAGRADEADEGEPAPAEGSEAASVDTPEARIAALEEELRKKTEEASKSFDQYLRERAEAENFKKRLQRDKVEAVRFGNEALLRELLPIIDNLELAVEHAGLGGDGQSVVEGVQMILRLFRDLLERFGVAPLDAIEGAPFDANVHEAIGREPRADVPPNTVLRQQLKGYRLNDRLLRAARVVVSAPGGRAPEGGAPDEEA